MAEVLFIRIQGEPFCLTVSYLCTEDIQFPVDPFLLSNAFPGQDFARTQQYACLGQHQPLLGIIDIFSFEYLVWFPHDTFPHFGSQVGPNLSTKASGKTTIRVNPIFLLWYL